MCHGVAWRGVGGVSSVLMDGFAFHSILLLPFCLLSSAEAATPGRIHFALLQNPHEPGPPSILHLLHLFFFAAPLRIMNITRCLLNLTHRWKSNRKVGHEALGGGRALREDFGGSLAWFSLLSKENLWKTWIWWGFFLTSTGYHYSSFFYIEVFFPK